MFNKRIRWGLSLSLALCILITTTQAGGKMNRLAVSRLGTENAGTDKEKTKESLVRLETNNLPTPIVLWNGDKAAGVLYFSVETRMITLSFSQKIDYLVSPTHGMTGRLRSLFDAYPITFTSHKLMSEDAEKTLNGLGLVYTKDVNGDGIDELILLRSLGDIEVYDREKLISRYTPETRPKLFEYGSKEVFHARVNNHDEMFLIAFRKPYGSADKFSESDKLFYRNTPNERVIRISPEGIKEIIPLFPDNARPKSIEAVAGLNKPGSNGIDELIIITTCEGKAGYYLSRHTLAGKAIDAPRKIYAENFDPDYYTFYPVPQSNQLIAHSSHLKKVCFITPEKPVNWFRSVSLTKLPGKDDGSGFIGQTKKNDIPVAVIGYGNNLFAIDANGKYHTSMKPDIGKEDKPAPLLTLTPQSKLHTIVAVKAVDESMEKFLVIQSRKPGIKELSIEELEKAGERFLSDSGWNYCKDRLLIQYSPNKNEYIQWYCEKNKIPMPEINSLEDIKNKLPGYYQEKVNESTRRYRDSLETGLFSPLESKKACDINQIIEESNYKNKEAYNRWLSDVFVPPELVFSIYHLSNGTVMNERLADYYYIPLDTGVLAATQNPINIKVSGDHGQVFLVLQKKVFDKRFKPAYYTIAW